MISRCMNDWQSCPKYKPLEVSEQVLRTRSVVIHVMYTGVGGAEKDERGEYNYEAMYTHIKQ